MASYILREYLGLKQAQIMHEAVNLQDKDGTI
jgi:hypothetical protein